MFWWSNPASGVRIREQSNGIAHGIRTLTPAGVTPRFPSSRPTLLRFYDCRWLGGDPPRIRGNPGFGNWNEHGHLFAIVLVGFAVLRHQIAFFQMDAETYHASPALSSCRHLKGGARCTLFTARRARSVREWLLREQHGPRG